jgi:hypothetical protein
MAAALEAKLKSCIEQGLQGGLAELETLPNGHVSGFVVSDEFDGMNYEQRRKRLRQLFNESLNADERKNIGVLLTYSPAEWNVKLEGI